ncbi:MAG: hypothetical protein HKL92_04490 [Candidatus Eremiobacteraeota bacterium]|nr:hypothetical protein [Candidatus Eremiobacteraeota bacterium]NNM92580.1 hypothetical protein [Candidatus Eremiobacteraeota bacterium]
MTLRTLSLAGIVALMAFPVGASAAIPAPVATAMPTPAPTALSPKRFAFVRSLFTNLQAGKIDSALFDARMNELLKPVVLSGLAKKLVPFGSPATILDAADHTTPSYRATDYLLRFTAGRSLIMRVAIDTKGKIAGLFFPNGL